MRTCTAFSLLLAVAPTAARRSITSYGRSSSSAASSIRSSVDSWAQPSSFFEDGDASLRRRVEVDSERRTSRPRLRSLDSDAADTTTARDSLSYFSTPDPTTSYDDTSYDDLLPPPMPEKVRAATRA